VDTSKQHYPGQRLAAPVMAKLMRLRNSPLLREPRAAAVGADRRLSHVRASSLEVQARRARATRAAAVDRLLSRMSRFARITVEPKKQKEQPCIRGLRITVRRVLEALAAYPDREELRREYPELTAPG
jgi:uncharacterized protein (DUF433 family)